VRFAAPIGMLKRIAALALALGVHAPMVVSAQSADLSLAVGVEEVTAIDGYASPETGDVLRGSLGWRTGRARLGLSLTRIEFSSARNDLRPGFTVDYSLGNGRIVPILGATVALNRSHPYGGLDFVVDQLFVGSHFGLSMRVAERLELGIAAGLSRSWELRTSGVELLDLADADLLYAPPRDERTMWVRAGVAVLF
jgi:hypothetical protein